MTLYFLEYGAYVPELNEMVSNKTTKHPRYINIPKTFEEGKDVFSLDGLLVLNFSIIRNPFLREYGQDGFDYRELRKADKMYRSRIVFMDNSGKRSFIFEINPVFSTIHMKSDYKKVRSNWITHQ